LTGKESVLSVLLLLSNPIARFAKALEDLSNARRLRCHGVSQT
jgi:hypothetical protein